MIDDLAKDLLPVHGEGIDPRELARRDMQKSLPNRFYRQAAFERDGAAFALKLDDKSARTPGRNLLAVHDEKLAHVLAAEWNAQEKVIDPATMPLTRLLHSALDGVAREMESVAQDMAKYAGSDLMCYRAPDPASLAAEQAQAWDPVVNWMREAHGARFTLTEGVMFVEQSAEAIACVRRAIDALVGCDEASPLRLASLHVMTTLTGSALLALAVASRFIGAEAAWNAAHVDEDFQARHWGEDDDAAARKARRWSEMEVAASVWG
jgi:chaperone required for assembly of F1-ATPase